MTEVIRFDLTHQIPNQLPMNLMNFFLPALLVCPLSFLGGCRKSATEDDSIRLQRYAESVQIREREEKRLAELQKKVAERNELEKELAYLQQNPKAIGLSAAILASTNALEHLKKANLAPVTQRYKLGPTYIDKSNPSPEGRFLMAAAANGLIASLPSNEFPERDPVGLLDLFFQVTNKGRPFVTLQEANGKWVTLRMADLKPEKVNRIGVPTSAGGKTVSIVHFDYTYLPTPFGELYDRENNGNYFEGSAQGIAIFAQYDVGWVLESWKRETSR